MKHKILKRIFTAFIAVIISLMCFTVAFAVNSGTCGTNVSWSFNEENGELLISGSGTMTDYSSADYVPWRSYTDKITKITVSEGVTSIGKYAFNGCKKAEEISIPAGIETIGYGSFDNCSSLKNISIPASVTKINSSPFYYCTSLVEITVAESNKKYCSDSNGILYNKDKTELIQYPCGKKEADFLLPFTVTTVNFGAFAGAPYIKNIILPESLSEIDSMAFYECTSLKIITIPKNLSMIGEKAFSNCTAISDVYFTGTQEKWNSVSIREGNDVLTSATFTYETKGPETAPTDQEENIQETTSAVQQSTTAVYPQQKLAQKREIIPIIIIVIAILVLILFIVLIRVIIKKPDKLK